MAYTPAVYTGDGSTTLFSFTFPYVKGADVIVTVDDVVTAYTFSTPNQVSIVPAPANGTEVRVARNTPIDMIQYIFDSGVPFLTKFADANWRQLLYSLQEYIGGLADIIGRFGRTVRAPEPIGELPDAATRANKLLTFDDDGQPLVLPYNLDSVPGLTLRVEALEDTATLHVATFASLASTPCEAGLLVTTLGHTTEGIGGRTFIGKVGVVAPGGDGGSRNASASPGFFWELQDLTYVSIADFGASPLSTAATDAALTACEASTFKIFHVPGYGYTTTKSFTTLTKTYQGEGQITSGADALPGNYTYLASKPSSPGPAVPPYIFQGDLSKTKAEYFIVGPGLRTAINEPYFVGQQSPRSQVFDNRSGESGLLCRITNNPAAGQPTIQVNSTQDVFVGQTLGLSSQIVVGAYLDTLVVQSFVPNTSITFTTNLTHAYVAGDAVSNGFRTSASWRIINVFHRGGGDCYSDVIRVEANYTKKPGQTHFYNTSTCGAFSGDTVASRPGNYMQMSEWQFSDNNNDVAVISEVRSFFRNNDTGAMGCIWNGTYYASGGSKAANSAHVVAGIWKRGLDLSLADFSAGGQAAISLARGQMIYWDNSGTLDVGGQKLWSNTLGTSKTYLDGSNNWNYERGANKWTFANSGATILPAQLQVGTSASVGTTLTTGLGIIAGADVSVPIGNKFTLNGVGGNSYLQIIGGNIILVKNGVTVATW